MMENMPSYKNPARQFAQRLGVINRLARNAWAREQFAAAAELSNVPPAAIDWLLTHAPGNVLRQLSVVLANTLAQAEPPADPATEPIADSLDIGTMLSALELESKKLAAMIDASPDLGDL